jgi:hypothetical protein
VLVVRSLDQVLSGVYIGALSFGEVRKVRWMRDIIWLALGTDSLVILLKQAKQVILVHLHKAKL